MKQLRAELAIPAGWERFEWQGTLGGVRHRAQTHGLHPNVLVTLDKWPGLVTAAQARTILTEQFAATDARLESITELPGRVPVLQAEVEQNGEDAHPVRVIYRLRLLYAGADTLVLTAIATCHTEQYALIDEDFAVILDSVELQRASDSAAQ